MDYLSPKFNAVGGSSSLYIRMAHIGFVSTSVLESKDGVSDFVLDAVIDTFEYPRKLKNGTSCGGFHQFSNPIWAPMRSALCCGVCWRGSWRGVIVATI